MQVGSLFLKYRCCLTVDWICIHISQVHYFEMGGKNWNHIAGKSGWQEPIRLCSRITEASRCRVSHFKATLHCSRQAATRDLRCRWCGGTSQPNTLFALIVRWSYLIQLISLTIWWKTSAVGIQINTFSLELFWTGFVDDLFNTRNLY